MLLRLHVKTRVSEATPVRISLRMNAVQGGCVAPWLQPLPTKAVSVQIGYEIWEERNRDEKNDIKFCNHDVGHRAIYICGPVNDGEFAGSGAA